MKAKFGVPRDIKKALLWRRIRFTFVAAGYYLLLTGSLVSYDYLQFADTGLPAENAFLFALLFIILPVFVFRFFRIFTERDYNGTVVRTMSDYTVTPAGSKSGMPSEVQRVTVYVMPDGGRFCKRYRMSDYDENYLGYYKNGDRVRHLPFSGSLIRLDRTDGAVLCAVCGKIEYIESRNRCFYCGHTLPRLR